MYDNIVKNEWEYFLDLIVCDNSKDKFYCDVFKFDSIRFSLIRYYCHLDLTLREVINLLFYYENNWAKSKMSHLKKLTIST